MKASWIHKDSNTDCILFFNGWGMDERAVSQLDNSGYDICMFSDYQSAVFSEMDFSAYERLYVIAWSLGVWNAAKCLSNSGLKFEKSLAINGTLKPINDLYGIPTKVFDLTLQNWSEQTRPKFNARVIGGNAIYQSNQNLFSLRTVENQKTELAAIQKHYQDSPELNFAFDTAIIGDNDLIFSSENQQRAWCSKAKVVNLTMPHFPFLLFKSWHEILSL